MNVTHAQVSSTAALPSAVPQATPRTIVHRTRGRAHGPVTRLVSPGDLGELIKPFVFLDSFASEPRGFKGFGWHPHSGIATISVILEGAVGYEETTGAKGVLNAGAVEFMRAGKGVWHTGSVEGSERVVGYQLWIALPADLEHAPAASQYLQREDVAAEGPCRVILGAYGNATSAIAAPKTMNYLVVDLKDGERWTYVPPAGHTVLWVSVHGGALLTPSVIAKGELAIFDRTEAAIDFFAEGDTSFVLGSAIPHPHDLVTGSYSVHTTREALQTGEAEIRRLHRETPILRANR